MHGCYACVYRVIGNVVGMDDRRSQGKQSDDGRQRPNLNGQACFYRNTKCKVAHSDFPQLCLDPTTDVEGPSFLRFDKIFTTRFNALLGIALPSGRPPFERSSESSNPPLGLARLLFGQVACVSPATMAFFLKGIDAFRLLGVRQDGYASRSGIQKGGAMSGQELFVILLVGLIAGWLAGQFVQGTGFGLVADIAIGVIGALIGSWLLPHLGLHLGSGIVAAIISATIGALVLLLILRLVYRRGRW